VFVLGNTDGDVLDLVRADSEASYTGLPYVSRPEQRHCSYTAVISDPEPGKLHDRPAGPEPTTYDFPFDGLT
jgi:hypothetical protein